MVNFHEKTSSKMVEDKKTFPGFKKPPFYTPKKNTLKKISLSSFTGEPRKKTRGPLLSIESWMVNDGILIMVYEIMPYITG